MGAAQPSGGRRARLAIICAVALIGAACSSPEEDPETDPSNASAESSQPESEPVDPEVTYAVHTVEPPGPLDGSQYGDDMLLASSEPIPDELIDQIASIRIDGHRAVAAVEQFSLSSFSLENRNYRIAAVDPAGYRRFTPGPNGAVFQDAWDRVANGEVAVLDSLDGRIPLDKDDYLAVGSGERTFPIHVGAWISQVGTIDAVVNTEWGEALGLPENNAVVINTGGFAPQAVKKKMAKLLDENMSVTDLDVVAQYGLDPNTFQTAQLVGTFSQAVGVYRYTPIGGGRVQPEASWVRDHIVTEQMPIIGSMTCNKYMMPQLRAALLEIQQRGLADKLHPNEYAGCFYPRFIAGTTTLSNHSFGLAFDINTPGNQRGTVGEIDREVVAIFKYWGFAWGGDWRYTDPMHFELERIVNPG
jgi:hypothetical protein